MIYGFDQWVFESKGFPESLVSPSDHVYNFLLSKVNWWFNKKNKEDYSEKFIIDWRKIEEKNLDFPIKKIKIKFSINILDKSAPKYITASAFFYRGDLPKKYVLNILDSLSEIERNDVTPSIDINIDIGENQKINMEKMKGELNSSIRHELTHLYQMFKIRKKYGKNKGVWRNNPITWDLAVLGHEQSKTFSDLLDITYFLITREEFDASLAEVTVGDNVRVQSKRKLINKFKEISPEKLIKLVRREMEEFYPDSDLEDIPKVFLEEYEKDCRKHRISPLKWALKLRNKNFDGFITSLLDIVKFKGDKWMKKSNKIQYGE